jgi:hypothetical protein
MLLVLDKATKIDDISDADIWQRSKAIKEMIGRVWLVIAKVWNISELASIAQKVFFPFTASHNRTDNNHQAISSIPEPLLLPQLPPREKGFHPPCEPVPFPSIVSYMSSCTWTGVDAEAALVAVASSQSVQESTGLDHQGLLQRFTRWSPDSALKDCTFSRATIF